MMFQKCTSVHLCILRGFIIIKMVYDPSYPFKNDYCREFNTLALPALAPPPLLDIDIGIGVSNRDIFPLVNSPQ